MQSLAASMPKKEIKDCLNEVDVSVGSCLLDFALSSVASIMKGEACQIEQFCGRK